MESHLVNGTRDGREAPHLHLAMMAELARVSMSDDQRRAVEDLDLTWAATVYNGLDLSHYRDVPHDPDGYLGFVGRIAEEKGPLAAIEVSSRTGLPLRMAAKVDPTDVPYCEEEVAPRMGSLVDFVDEMTEAVGRIDEIDPEACRRGAERFSAERMCQGYGDVYHSLLGSRVPRPRLEPTLDQPMPSGMGEN